MQAECSRSVTYFGEHFEYVAMTMRPYNKFILMNANEDVLNIVDKVVAEINKAWYGSQRICMLKHNYHGTFHGNFCIKLPGTPFSLYTGKESATIGKVFISRIFEEMDKLGYEFVTCSELAQRVDNGTLIFKKYHDGKERENRPVLCIAPGGNDKISLVRCPKNVESAIKDAIARTMTYGLQSYDTEQILGALVTKIKFRGCPWIKFLWNSVECRKLIVILVENLERLNWKFHAAVNIKGNADALFFMYHSDIITSKNLGILSLNGKNRLRLIRFENDSQIIQAMIRSLTQTTGLQPKMKSHYGSTEFKVSGDPFYTFSGHESIRCREMIADTIKVFRENGYEVVTGLDIKEGNTVRNKSSILLRKCDSSSDPHACISIHNKDKIRIINFPIETTGSLERVIQQYYYPGVQAIKEKPSQTYCMQLKLKGYPWYSGKMGHGTHGKFVLLMLLREATRMNWELVASLDLSSTPCIEYYHEDHPLDVDTWVFRYKGAQGNQTTGMSCPLMLGGCECETSKSTSSANCNTFPY